MCYSYTVTQVQVLSWIFNISPFFLIPFLARRTGNKEQTAGWRRVCRLTGTRVVQHGRCTYVFFLPGNVRDVAGRSTSKLRLPVRMVPHHVLNARDIEPAFSATTVSP